MADSPRARYLRNRQSEIDGATLYRAMAEGEADPAIARVYRELADTEEKHARFWDHQIKKLGATLPERRPSWRARVLAFSARRFGPRTVLGLVAADERRGRNVYLNQPETAETRMTAQERSHALVLQSLLREKKGASGEELVRLESQHGAISGNTLRAAVLGANDGLCTNLALVMGIAGASPAARAVIVGGVAGLLAGACSMAIGEWLSVQSARELAERELAIERDELAVAPEEERQELQLIYEARGMPAGEARETSQKLVADESAALGVLAREELGIDPRDLGGSPRKAALTSFVLFASGAIVPLLPFFFLRGWSAVAASAGLSAAALFGVGSAITLFTGRSIFVSGARQLALGLAAAALTFGIGRALS